jgi:hypothetical protein
MPIGDPHSAKAEDDLKWLRLTSTSMSGRNTGECLSCLPTQTLLGRVSKDMASEAGGKRAGTPGAVIGIRWIAAVTVLAHDYHAVLNLHPTLVALS